MIVSTRKVPRPVSASTTRCTLRRIAGSMTTIHKQTSMQRPSTHAVSSGLKKNMIGTKKTSRTESSRVPKIWAVRKPRIFPTSCILRMTSPVGYRSK